MWKETNRKITISQKENIRTIAQRNVQTEERTDRKNREVASELLDKVKPADIFCFHNSSFCFILFSVEVPARNFLNPQQVRT